MIERLIVGLLFEATLDAMTRRSHEIAPALYDRMIRIRESVRASLGGEPVP